jgi:hypothetical protein
MRLPRDEDALLRQLYVEFRIPTDQYVKPQRHAELRGFVRAWNDATGRDDAPEDILRYMVNMRKSGRKGPGWPTLDGDYERLAGPRSEVLTEAEWNHLRGAYAELFIANEIGSDQLAYSSELRANLARAFFLRTGRRVSGELLHALIEAKRKRGLWLAIKRDAKRSTGFGDINEIS